MKRIAILLIALIILFSTTIALAANTRTTNGFSYEVKGNGTATIVGYNGSGDIIIPQMLDGYTVASIGDNAFYSAKKSDKQISITIPETIRTIGDFSFWNMNIASINIPDSVEYIGKGAFVGSNDCNFRISTNHPKYAIIQGALYDKSKKELIKGKEGMIIPEGILSIGDYSCYDIGRYDWNGNVVKSDARDRTTTFIAEQFLLPSTVKRIGDYAFAHSTIRFNDSTRNYASLDEGYKLSIKINDNITEIGDYAFEGVDFRILRTERQHIKNDYYNLILPSSIKAIGEGCFKGTKNSSWMGSKYDPYFITMIPFEASIREIPAYAFSGSCINIVINTPIEEIGEKAFYNSDVRGINWEAVEEIGESALEEAEYKVRLPIPGTCETISARAFFNADLLGFTLSDGVEVVGEKAFHLKNEISNTIYLPGSLTDIAIDAFPLYSQYEVESGSYAQRWADENAFNYSVRGEEQNLDWLNN